VPALVGFRAVVGGVAWLDGQIANELLGTSVEPPVSSPGPRGFWRRAGNVLGDGAFWRQQSYLLLRLSFGFGIAVAEWALFAASLGLATMPIWYRWGHVEVGDHWRSDTLDRAFLCVPVGLAGLAVALALVRPIAAASRAVVTGLLGGDGVTEAPPTERRRARRRALLLHALAYAALNAVLIVIWAGTGGGYFWPEWALLPLALPLAVHAWIELVEERRWRPTGLLIHAGLVAVLSVFFTLVWAVTSRGYFWPAWAMLGLGITLLLHAAAVLPGRGARERIAALEETRAGAVDLQESELRRIERDLHDGAQARLVALGMSLGLAEQKLASDPAAAQELLAEARRGTHEALEELRSLARGIHPPVLADRGLEAAISALADRTPLRVDVSVDLPRRPPDAVETAAYFVVAEALANAGKHAGAGRVEIGVRYVDGRVVVEVVDDGSGGADAAGGGLGGLAQRVGALDGRLEVTSPSGGPTRIEAVIPCVL
jgi:signal transduction histidine kinase